MKACGLRDWLIRKWSGLSHLQRGLLIAYSVCGALLLLGYILFCIDTSGWRLEEHLATIADSIWRAADIFLAVAVLFSAWRGCKNISSQLYDENGGRAKGYKAYTACPWILGGLTALGGLLRSTIGSQSAIQLLCFAGVFVILIFVWVKNDNRR